jgi:hypothetical protein
MDEQTMNRPIVIGRVARADVCPCAHSVVLSLGALSLRLEAAAAEDVALTLMQALALINGGAPATDATAVAAGATGSPDGNN